MDRNHERLLQRDSQTEDDNATSGTVVQYNLSDLWYDIKMTGQKA